MKIGDVVVVLGKLDKRVREQAQEGLVLGTLDQFLDQDRVSVILESMDIWIGLKREVIPYKEQQ